MKFIKKNPSSVTDEQNLLSRYKQTGDLKLLGELYTPYMPLIYGLCLKYLKDEHQSKDAVMQIFEELIRKLRIHEVLNFKSWLYTLSRNYCLMHLRASGKHETVSLEDNFMEYDQSVHLDPGELREEQLTVMEECMKALPAEQMRSIDLFYLQQKCYKDIADITGFEISKVKSYIQNGKRNLKICMEKKGTHE